MVSENPVYLKIEHKESYNSKKSILSAEISLLNVAKIIRRYQLLREEEFILRTKIYKLIREANTAIKETRSTFPYVKIPERKKIEEIKLKEKRESEEEDKDLEQQLKEIQEKLKELEINSNQ
jgi:hypothetical protein